MNNVHCLYVGHKSPCNVLLNTTCVHLHSSSLQLMLPVQCIGSAHNKAIIELPGQLRTTRRYSLLAIIKRIIIFPANEKSSMNSLRILNYLVSLASRKNYLLNKNGGVGKKYSDRVWYEPFFSHILESRVAVNRTFWQNLAVMKLPQKSDRDSRTCLEAETYTRGLA